jgi:hypothetical protein
MSLSDALHFGVFKKWTHKLNVDQRSTAASVDSEGFAQQVASSKTNRLLQVQVVPTLAAQSVCGHLRNAKHGKAATLVAPKSTIPRAGLVGYARKVALCKQQLYCWTKAKLATELVLCTHDGQGSN